MGSELPLRDWWQRLGSRDGPRPTGPGSGTGGACRAPTRSRCRLRSNGTAPSPARPGSRPGWRVRRSSSTARTTRSGGTCGGWSPAAMAIANCSASPTPGPTSPGSRRSQCGRRRLGRQRPEGVDVGRPGRQQGDAGCTHERGRAQTRWDLILPDPHGPARHRGSSAAGDDRPQVLQRGVHHRCPRPPQTSSAVTAGAGPWPTRRSPSSAPVRGLGRPRPQGRARSPATSTGPPARSSLPPAPTHRRSPRGRVTLQRLAALAREADAPPTPPSARAWPGCTRWNGCSR